MASSTDDYQPASQLASSSRPPSRTQLVPWESGELAATMQNQSGFPYTSSFQDSYTPYDSPSAAWNGAGADASGRKSTDDFGDGQLEYNPADFDSHSTMQSPFLMLDGSNPGIPSDFLSVLQADLAAGNQQLGKDQNNGYVLSEEPASDYQGHSIFGLHPQRSNSAPYDGRFSPRPDTAPSPASSVGFLEQQDRFARSRASSIASNRHPSPAITAGLSDSLDRLAVDSVDSDIIWRNQQQQQLNQQKPNSPPQLFIPQETQNNTNNNNSLQIPGFGQPQHHSMGGLAPGGAMGGLAAPSINLLPATPVSGGGAGSSHVPFQTVLKTLTEQRQPEGQQTDNGGMSSQVSSPFATPGPSSRPSTPGLQQQHHNQATGPVDFSFAAPSNNAPFQFPSSSPTPPPPTLGQGLSQFFNPNQRSRSYSDASRPAMSTLDQSLDQSHIMRPHPSLGGPSYSPSFGQLAPPNLSSMARSSPSNRSSPFNGSTDSLPLGSYSPVPPVADLGMGMPTGYDTGLVVGQQRHRSSRSEDFGRAPPFASPPSHMLTPAYGQMGGGVYGYTPSMHDGGLPSSIGPARTARRGSSSSHHERVGSSSSIRVSPYPSPSASPAMVANMLPSQNGENPWVKVERQQVTTPATAKASEGRRKGEATFVCPVPGCHSTFTRHFNLKGHLRSHNEERPFKCKWPGCEKGFARQHDCKRHEALHLNLRPYTCEGCKKTFARMDALNRHLKSEGGVDCARAQGGDNASYGVSLKAEELSNGAWPTMGRALAM